MSCATQCNDKASEKVEPILHWETPHSMPYGCDAMYKMFNQGLNINHRECDDCPSEDENDAPSLAPNYLSKSVSSSESEYDKSEYDEFGEDPWDKSEFTTYRCTIVKVGHIPSEPIINPQDYEDELDNVIGIHIHCVTLSKENVYQPKSIHDNTVDLKLSKIACKSAQGNLLHFKQPQFRIDILPATTTSTLPHSLVLWGSSVLMRRTLSTQSGRAQ
jgi:hypothetical protein